MIISVLILVRLRNVSDKICRENQSTPFMFNNSFPKIEPFIKNVEKYDEARQVIDGDTQQALPLNFIRKKQGGKNFEIIILITIVNVLQLHLSDSLQSSVKMFTYLSLKFEAMFHHFLRSLIAVV